MDQTNEKNTPVIVCDVQFRSGSKVYYFDPGALNVRTGDEIILDTSHGLEFAQCVQGNHTVTQREIVAPLRPVLRIATSNDKKINQNNRILEKKAQELCAKKIEELGLVMQLVSTEYAFDGSKILFFFTADERVDFRELVRILASNLHARIELRQIGVRDKAKMVGGLGICGRPFCCREFLDDFQPVSIKMAKTQSLSLNPTKISGTCGRLMCCLNYEQETYEDLLRNCPKPESFVDTPDGRGTITDVNLLRQSVNVRLEKQPDTVVCHKNCDICVLRSGKARKTDEPIPDDLAPISGGKAHAQRETAFTTYLEPVILRSQTEPIPAVEGPAGEKTGGKRRRNGKKHRPSVQEQPKQPEAPVVKEPAASGKKAEQKPQKKSGQKPGKKPEQRSENVKKQEPAAGSPAGAETQKPKGGKRRYYKRRKPGEGKPQQG